MISYSQYLLVSMLINYLPTSQSQVFICKGPMSKVYHKSARCKGLSSCSTVVYEIGLDEAKRLGRRSCKIEFK